MNTKLNKIKVQTFCYKINYNGQTLSFLEQNGRYFQILKFFVMY